MGVGFLSGLTEGFNAGKNFEFGQRDAQSTSDLLSIKAEEAKTKALADANALKTSMATRSALMKTIDDTGVDIAGIDGKLSAYTQVIKNKDLPPDVRYTAYEEMKKTEKDKMELSNKVLTAKKDKWESDARAVQTALLDPKGNAADLKILGKDNPVIQRLAEVFSDERMVPAMYTDDNKEKKFSELNKDEEARYRLQIRQTFTGATEQAKTAHQMAVESTKQDEVYGNLDIKSREAETKAKEAAIKQQRAENEKQKAEAEARKQQAKVADNIRKANENYTKSLGELQNKRTALLNKAGITLDEVNSHSWHDWIWSSGLNQKEKQEFDNIQVQLATLQTTHAADLKRYEAESKGQPVSTTSTTDTYVDKNGKTIIRLK